jgi:hypothetical protein
VRHKHVLPPPRHKVVRQRWLPRAANMQAECLDLCHFCSRDLVSDLLLRDHRKSSRAHSQLRCPPSTPSLSFLFRPRDRSGQNLTTSTSPHPSPPPHFIALFNKEIGSLTSLCYPAHPKKNSTFNQAIYLSSCSTFFPLIVKI